MFPLKLLSCTRCFSYLREKWSATRNNTTSLYPSVAIEVRPQTQDYDRSDVPTIFAEVQELNFDRNGRPNIIIVNSSQSTSKVSSNQSFSQENRWAFPSQVEDLQLEGDTTSIPEHGSSRDQRESRETEKQEWKPSLHLQKYLVIMYSCCTATLPKARQSSYDNQKSWGWLRYIQRAFFWIVVACTAFDLACQSKLCLLKFLSGEGFNALVNFAFCLISLGTAIKFACLLCREQDMAKMFNIICNYEEGDIYERRMSHASIVLGILTTLFACALQVFSFGQNLLLWNYNNITTTNDKILDQFFEPSAFNIFLGIALMIRDFLSSLFIGMMWDLILIVSLVLACWKHVFVVNHAMEVVNNIKSPTSSDARTLQLAREAVFNKWQAYKIVYEHVNTVFGPFLPLFHITNVLMYASFLSICILPDETSTVIVYVNLLYTIGKAEFTYALSSRLTKQNEIMRKLLRNWGIRTGKISVDGEDWDLNALLDELDSEPMVFGTGNFAINQRFHFGIIGLVGSLFVSLANGIGKISSGS